MNKNRNNGASTSRLRQRTMHQPRGSCIQMRMPPPPAPPPGQHTHPLDIQAEVLRRTTTSCLSVRTASLSRAADGVAWIQDPDSRCQTIRRDHEARRENIYKKYIKYKIYELLKLFKLFMPSVITLEFPLKFNSFIF